MPEEKQDVANVIPDKTNFIPKEKQATKEQADLPRTGEAELITRSFLGFIVTLGTLYWFFKRKYQKTN